MSFVRDLKKPDCKLHKGRSMQLTVHIINKRFSRYRNSIANEYVMLYLKHKYFMKRLRIFLNVLVLLT